MVIVIWDLVKNGREIIAALEQDAADLLENGRGGVLDVLIPTEHAEAAQDGEWNPEGFVYHVGDDWYVVQCHRAEDMFGRDGSDDSY